MGGVGIASGLAYSPKPLTPQNINSQNAGNSQLSRWRPKHRNLTCSRTERLGCFRGLGVRLRWAEAQPEGRGPAPGTRCTALSVGAHSAGAVSPRGPRGPRGRSPAGVRPAVCVVGVSMPSSVGAWETKFYNLFASQASVCDHPLTCY